MSLPPLRKGEDRGGYECGEKRRQNEEPVLTADSLNCGLILDIIQRTVVNYNLF